MAAQKAAEMGHALRWFTEAQAADGRLERDELTGKLLESAAKWEFDAVRALYL